MSYRTKSGIKAERKMGFDAVKALLADASWPKDKILACAKQNEDAFGKLDDLPDADFIVAMEDMRQNHYDTYRVFWWWRKAHETAGRNSEEDGEIKGESKHAVFEVCQFLARPWSDDWEDDRQHLKPGVTPLVTEAQMRDGLDHKTIKKWVLVCHDRDVYTEEDEIADKTGRIRAGDPKFTHWHAFLTCSPKMPVSTIARWFGVPEHQVEIKRGRGAFLDCAEYAVHESPRAKEQGKTHYDDDEVDYEGFDFRREINELKEHRKKYGKRAGEMSRIEIMQDHVMKDHWTLRQCRNDDPLTYYKCRNTLPGLRLDMLTDAEPCPFRLNIYIDGPGSVGKSVFSEYIAEAMFPNADKPFFTIGGDDRVTFDGYDGEPAIIWDDMRVTDFIRQFGSNGTYRILDPHPRNIAQQSKHSRTILVNSLNIINGVQPYEEFISGLAGTYKDRYGVQHEAEDENQAWRRFPMIICLREQDFDVLINQGFVDNDLRSIKTMRMFAHVRGSIKLIKETFEDAARKQMLQRVGKHALNAIKLIDSAHSEKISDPDLIPEEFADYGTYETGEEYEARLKREAESNLFSAAEKDLSRRLGWLLNFVWYLLTDNECYATFAPKFTFNAFRYGQSCNYDGKVLWVKEGHGNPTMRNDAEVPEDALKYLAFMRNNRTAVQSAISAWHGHWRLSDGTAYIGGEDAKTAVRTFSHETICAALEFVWVRMNDEGHAVIEDDDYTPTDEATKEAFAELGIELVDDAGKDNG